MQVLLELQVLVWSSLNAVMQGLILSPTSAPFSPPPALSVTTQSKVGCTIYFPVLKAGFWQSGLGGLSEERWLVALLLSRYHAAVQGSASAGCLSFSMALCCSLVLLKDTLHGQGTTDIFRKCRWK